MANPNWTHVPNPHTSHPSSISPAHFTLTTPPKTDIWRPSSMEDVFTAPYIYTALRSSAFRRLAVTLSAPWKTLYDQGGLLLVWPRGANTPVNQRRWVKFGLEVFEGAPALGVVGTDRFSDWSLSPLPAGCAGASEGRATVRFSAERAGTTLWVYVIGEDGSKKALREIKWAFLDEEGPEGDLWVGPYAAKPTAEENDAKAGLEVEFWDLELETE